MPSDPTREKLDEVEASGSRVIAPACRTELGDLLFAMVNVVRPLGLDAEQTLAGPTPARTPVPAHSKRICVDRAWTIRRSLARRAGPRPGKRSSPDERDT